MQELFCNTTNKCDEGDGANSDAGHASRAQTHQLRARIWPFGAGWVGELAQHYGKRDGRGLHNVGSPRGHSITIVQNGKLAHEIRARQDTSKYAPKNPKAGAPVAGYRAPKGSK